MVGINLIQFFLFCFIMFIFTDKPGRNADFEEKAADFAAHSTKLAETAKIAAHSCGSQNKQTLDAINSTSSQV